MQGTRKQEAPLHFNYQQGQDIKETQALNKQGFLLSSQVASVSFMLQFEKNIVSLSKACQMLWVSKAECFWMLINNYAPFIQASMVAIHSGLNIIFSFAFVVS